MFLLVVLMQRRRWGGKRNLSAAETDRREHTTQVTSSSRWTTSATGTSRETPSIGDIKVWNLCHLLGHNLCFTITGRGKNKVINEKRLWKGLENHKHKSQVFQKEKRKCKLQQRACWQHRGLRKNDGSRLERWGCSHTPPLSSECVKSWLTS